MPTYYRVISNKDYKAFCLSGHLACSPKPWTKSDGTVYPEDTHVFLFDGAVKLEHVLSRASEIHLIGHAAAWLIKITAFAGFRPKRDMSADGMLTFVHEGRIEHESECRIETVARFPRPRRKASSVGVPNS